jgi:hypothetical protein
MNKFGFSARRAGKLEFLELLEEQALNQGKTVARIGLVDGKTVVTSIRGPNVAKDITPAKPLQLEKK